MEYLKVTKAPNVTLFKRGHFFQGDLHLTNHHLIFTYAIELNGKSLAKELWLSYPIIHSVELKSGSCLLDVLHVAGTSEATNDTGHVIQNLRDIAKLYQGACIKIKSKDFLHLSFNFAPADVKIARDVFDSMKKLTCVASIDMLYAFLYNPIPIETKFDSWKIYNVIQEFERQGLDLGSGSSTRPGSNSWRVSKINGDYQFCESYGSLLVVPKSISDNVLKYAAKFRSKSRIPSLTYYYKKNGCTITRSSQPLTGISQSRSIQDEKLVFEIFASNQAPELASNSTSSMPSDSSMAEYGKHSNLIVDARPTANAMAQTALGAGTEIIDNYRGCKKKFLGIDNIHVMRDSLDKIHEILKDSDLLTQLPVLTSANLYRTGWLKHLQVILNGVDLTVRSIWLNNSHVLVHCSDGWDRTPQICSLSQICLDPYFRTLEGFIVLIEKDWSSFGHRFKERSGHLSSETKFVSRLNGESAEDADTDDNDSFPDPINTASKSFSVITNHFKKRKHVKFTSPTFQQFLDCVYQIYIQFPEKFEFNERFLRRLVYHLYSCQYGNFLVDCEAEKVKKKLTSRTRSVWDYFLARKAEFTNKDYKPSEEEEDVILVNTESLKWWYQFFGRSNEEMNGMTVGELSSERLNKKLARIVENTEAQSPKTTKYGKATRETNLSIMKEDLKKRYGEIGYSGSITVADSGSVQSSTSSSESGSSQVAVQISMAKLEI